MSGVIIAVEDVLGDVVCRKLLERERVDISHTVGQRGNSYLRAKAVDFNRVSLRVPVIMLTDLDRSSLCPAELIRSWLGGVDKGSRFLLRVAVREVESWIMAHREAFADYLGIAEARIPRDTDGIMDPKEYVVALGRHSRKREIRRALVPVPQSTATVGPGYNRELSIFVREHWDPDKARLSSRSLDRTLSRLREL